MSVHPVDAADDPTPPAPVLERHRLAGQRLAEAYYVNAEAAAERVAQALADAEAAAYVRGYNAGHETATEQAAERNQAQAKAAGQVRRVQTHARQLEEAAARLDAEAMVMHGKPTADHETWARQHTTKQIRAGELRDQATAIRAALKG